MEDFRDERILLEEAGAGITVHTQEELFVGIWGLLERPDILRTRGEAGRQAVAANKGAAERYAALIADVLK
jgi:3-deoxy-D-manno-octulosonic-acid transferase